MTYGHDRQHRRSIRLRGYDYTRAGVYFITICSRDRSCILSEIRADIVRLTPIGEIVASCWVAIPEHFPTAELDVFVVMPNHLHGIIVFGAEGEASQGTACRAPTDDAPTSRLSLGTAPSVERFGAPVAGSIPTIVRSFKSAVTKAINDDPGRGTACRAFLTGIGPLPPGRIPAFWQSNYYEHVIRNDRSLEQIRAYIDANPARWAEDTLHPHNPDAPTPGRSRSRHP